MFQCKYCKEGFQEGFRIETITGAKRLVQFYCQNCRYKAEKEMEVAKNETRKT